MTDQTPPPGQPTPRPRGGRPGDWPRVAASPPPPPPPGRDRRRYAAAAARAAEEVADRPDHRPRRRPGGPGAHRRRVVVIVFVAKGDEKHSIATPATAGGMKRDKAKETELKTQLGAAEKQFKTQSKKVTYVKSGALHPGRHQARPEGLPALPRRQAQAVGEEPDHLRQRRSPSRPRRTGSRSRRSRPARAAARPSARSRGSARRRSPSAPGPPRTPIGELLPTVPGYDSKQLAKIMLDLRADVEKTE